MPIKTLTYEYFATGEGMTRAVAMTTIEDELDSQQPWHSR